MAANGNSNGNGVKTRDLIIRLLTWLIPISFITGGVILGFQMTSGNVPEIQKQVHQHDKKLDNHEIRLKNVEKTLDDFTTEQKAQTKLLLKIYNKP